MSSQDPEHRSSIDIWQDHIVIRWQFDHQQQQKHQQKQLALDSQQTNEDCRLAPVCSQVFSALWS